MGTRKRTKIAKIQMPTYEIITLSSYLYLVFFVYFHMVCNLTITLCKIPNACCTLDKSAKRFARNRCNRESKNKATI